MKEALKLALDALEDVGVLTDREWQAVHKNKANELRQAIAELESQEPVAVVDANDDGYWADILPNRNVKVGQFLYAHPPQRTEQEPVTSSLVECVMSARKEFSAIKGESQFCTECHAFERADSWWQEWHGGDIDYITGAVYTYPPQRTEPVALPCCGYTDASAVKWNSLNGVVQCHNCGQNYTTSQRTWVGLTEQEQFECMEARYEHGMSENDIPQIIEAKLKEKNT